MATYIAWDGNEYPMPTPEGWYLGTDDRWWPEGHGPGPAPVAAPPADSGLPATGLPSAAPPLDNAPDWASAQETTIYSSPLPSSSGAASAADPTVSGGGGNGKTLAVIGAVLVGLIAMGGLAFVLLDTGDDDEATSTSTLFPAEESEPDNASAATTEPGDEPASTVSVVPGKGSIEDPYAIGEQIVVEYSDGATGELRTWTIEVLGAASDITDAVLAENQFNDGPDGDLRFIGAPLRVTYVSGPAPASLFELTFKAVGPSGVVLTTFDPSCGVIPDALDTFAEIFEGGAVEGNVCWAASPGDADDLTMVIEVFLEDTEIHADLGG